MPSKKDTSPHRNTQNFNEKDMPKGMYLVPFP